MVGQLPCYLFLQLPCIRGLALHVAAMRGQLDLCAWLLEVGAPINAKDQVRVAMACLLSTSLMNWLAKPYGVVLVVWKLHIATCYASRCTSSVCFWDTFFTSMLFLWVGDPWMAYNCHARSVLLETLNCCTSKCWSEWFFLFWRRGGGGGAGAGVGF